MDQLIKTFHIDWTLMVAQLVNFAVVFFVLYQFALRPLMKIMKERSQIIANSLERAKKIEGDWQRTNEEISRKIAKANKESAELIIVAQREAEDKKRAIIKETEKRAAKIVVDAKAEISRQKEQLVAEAREEMIDLVVAATSKVLEKKIDVSQDRSFIDAQVTKLKSDVKR